MWGSAGPAVTPVALRGAAHERCLRDRATATSRGRPGRILYLLKLRIVILRMAEKPSAKPEQSPSESGKESTGYRVKVSHKRKLQNKETPTAKKLKPSSEPVKESIPAPLPHVPIPGPRGEAAENQRNDDSIPTLHPISECLKTMKTIEKRLVYTDEDISFEFADPAVSASTQSVSHGSTLPSINKLLHINLNQARACYRHKNYAAAVEHFSGALELFNRGISVEDLSEASADDISSIASFIETKLAMCYLKMNRPSDALTHAHRSISRNPAHFQSHMRQAAAFRALGRYSEAARSTMIADYIYWLRGGTKRHTSKYIRYYWQAMIEEAITTESSFSVLYTPSEAEKKAQSIISKIQHTFAEKNPEYLQYHYTDPQAFHILPKSTKWLSGSPRLHFLTLGFRSKTVGKLVEKWTSRKLSMLSDQTAPFNTLLDKEAEKYWKSTGQKVMAAMDFIRSTKLTDPCPCSRAIEKLQQASLFGRMQSLEKRDQLLEQVLAEIATLPYLQDLSQEDTRLLELLMADAMDTLGGRIDNQRVWNQLLKIGLLKDYMHEEEDYIKSKKLSEARRERRKQTRSLQQAESPRTAPRTTPGGTPQTAGNTGGSTPQSRSQRLPERPQRTPGSRARRTSRKAPQRSRRTSGSRAGGAAGIAPELLSLVRPCSVVLQRLDFPPYPSGR
ncbi:spermatogenesis-associated protein 16-like [Pogoniulus pusillus]|uniref:spermatogenesis-associated protein 16-like n=1 Tax=Pogoniulus pusillus TaxID=488313 RepID=UPI0030B9850E